MNLLQRFLEWLIENLSEFYFNRYFLLVECDCIDQEFLVLYRDYEVEE